MKLPSPETYEEQLRFMPYIKSLEIVRDIVCADAPKDVRVLDLMCGPGYLLRQIQEKRKDLSFVGIDIDEKYIRYAKRSNQQGVMFLEVGNILESKEPPTPVVLCTGALHHLPYEKQEVAIERIAAATSSGGFAIVSDCYIDQFMASHDRQLAAAKLGYRYLTETINNGAPREVVQATLEIMANDICEREFKVPLDHRLLALKRNFRDVKTMKVWPNKQIGGFGDYIHILRK